MCVCVCMYSSKRQVILQKCIHRLIKLLDKLYDSEKNIAKDGIANTVADSLFNNSSSAVLVLGSYRACAEA